MPLWVFFFVILTLSSSSHCSPPPPLTLRMRRYADAIFTNSYRKVLGQLSARKLLQDIMSRQQGERNEERGATARLGRQVDSVWAEQKQMELESILVALLQKHRYGCVCMCASKDFRASYPMVCWEKEKIHSSLKVWGSAKQTKNKDPPDRH
ncbi:somatoliberin isoform X1 [Chlorocebus sabaeus]|uniref:somatoliberin isoform X1 n=1 Tax=Chlorocebus sabaeus TaxID=60711 RepID=UPI00045E17EB